MKSLIIGLGNPIMGDDAIGCRCAQVIETILDGLPGVEVDQFFRGGISLMERLIGYDRVLIIDSIVGSGRIAGSIVSLSLDDLPSQNISSPHDATLKDAIKFGVQMGELLPSEVDILAVEIEQEFEFSQQLSPEVESCIPSIVDLALSWLSKERLLTDKDLHKDLSINGIPVT